MSNKLFIFRHAETIDNKERVFSGLRDVDLTPQGVQQAQELAEKLADEQIDISFASPLKRAQRSLRIVLRPHQDTSICLDKRLIERNYGWLQGHSKDRLAKLAYPLFKIWHRSYRVAPPGGESLQAVRQRVLPFIYDLENIMRTRQVNCAICVHGNSIRAFREYFEELPREEFTQIETTVGQLFQYEVG